MPTQVAQFARRTLPARPQGGRGAGAPVASSMTGRAWVACYARLPVYDGRCGRSSIATWRNSVLRFVGTTLGQRSADDQTPQRWHLLCVRFGTASYRSLSHRRFIIGQIQPMGAVACRRLRAGLPYVPSHTARRRFALPGRRRRPASVRALPGARGYRPAGPFSADSRPAPG